MKAEHLSFEHHAEPLVNLYDRVSVDGRRGTAVGFYARKKRAVLVRLDVDGLIEVAESRITVEIPDS